MRLKQAFETMAFDDRILAIPVGEKNDSFPGVIKLNETSARIFELLKEETTEEAIVETMEKEYEAPREVIAADVRKCIRAFEEKGLLNP